MEDSLKKIDQILAEMKSQVHEILKNSKEMSDITEDLVKYLQKANEEFKNTNKLLKEVKNKRDKVIGN